MAAPVWVLSVDLQTKTATFQSGMADAARSARGSFNDIKTHAAEMSGSTGASMMEARHGVMLLGEEFGVHLPRGLTTFIAELGPVGPAMAAAFPFIAIALGATLLLTHLAKVREEAARLAEDQTKFSTAVFNTFDALDTKILQAGIRADELSKDHLGALRKQLELVDRQSMDELVHSLEEVAKAADTVFADLKTKWFEQGQGSEGAKHALEQFKNEYDNLLAQGKKAQAADLLAGTLDTARKVLDLQKQAQKDHQDTTDASGVLQLEDIRASNALKQMGIGFTQKEVDAQQQLVDVLQAQLGVQDRVSQLKKLEDSNEKRSTQQTMGDEAGQAAFRRAQEENRIQTEADKLQMENYDKAIAALREREKEKIEATDQGSAERLAAIDAAIREENTRGLQETDFYRGLLVSRVQVAKQMADEQEKIEAEAGKIAADHAEKMGELQLAADKESAQLRMSAHRVLIDEQIAEQLQESEALFKVKQAAFAQEIAALDKQDKDYENKLKAAQNKEKELVRAHENEITQIKDKAEEERNSRILSAEQRLQDEIARGLTGVLMRHESFGKMMVSLGDQVASGMIQNAIKSILADDMTKERDAAAAARAGYLAGMKFPFPANLVMAPTLAAEGFASVMMYAQGGIVPGVDLGDVVPAMLTPGEAILPKALTENLTRASGSGGGGDTHVHLHFRPTYHVNTIDGDGIKNTLRKHSDEFSRHFHNEIRKMNLR